MQVHLKNIWVEFVYQGYRVKNQDQDHRSQSYTSVVVVVVERTD